MSVAITGIPQTATGTGLVNHLNDRFRRISAALGTSGLPGPAGPPGAAGSATSVRASRRGVAVPGTTARPIDDFVGEHLSVTDFGADPSGSVDSTAAIQAAINYAGSNRVSLYVPAGTYLIGGAGLSWSGQSSLYGPQSLSDGIAILIYTGAGTALTIGDGITEVFAANLIDISILAAVGATPQYGINAQFVSQARWDGLSVGTGAASGTWSKAAVRISECSEINITHFLCTNGIYDAGTVGLLLDEFIAYGNSTIGVACSEEGGFFGFGQAIVLRSAVGCSFRDGFTEGCDYAMTMDNTTAFGNPASGVYNTVFDGWDFLLATVTGPANNKVALFTSVTGNRFIVNNLVFRGCRVFGAGGITYPLVLNIPDMAVGSVVTMKFDTCYGAGIVGALVSCNNAAARLFFTGQSDLYDAGGVTRPADFSGAATATDYAPTDVNQNALVRTDPTGYTMMAGSTANSMTRPPQGFVGAGVLVGTTQQDPNNDDGWMRFWCGGIPYPILAATNANPVVFETLNTAPASGSVVVSGLTGLWAAANGLATATNISTFAFSVPIDSTGFGPLTGTPGLVPAGNISQSVAIDLSGFNTNTDMDRTIVFYIGGQEWLRLDPTGITVASGVGLQPGGGPLNIGGDLNLTVGALSALMTALSTYLTAAMVLGAMGYPDFAHLAADVFSLMGYAQITTAIGGSGYSGTVAGAAGKNVVNGIIQP